MQNMIDEGCEIIICNSFNYGEYIMQVAKERSEIIFLHATGVEIDKNVATYFGRILYPADIKLSTGEIPIKTILGRYRNRIGI